MREEGRRRREGVGGGQGERTIERGGEGGGRGEEGEGYEREVADYNAPRLEDIQATVLHVPAVG